MSLTFLEPVLANVAVSGDDGSPAVADASGLDLGILDVRGLEARVGVCPDEGFELILLKMKDEVGSELLGDRHRNASSIWSCQHLTDAIC
jgi:hypothetical protein